MRNVKSRPFLVSGATSGFATQLHKAVSLAPCISKDRSYGMGIMFLFVMLILRIQDDDVGRAATGNEML